MAFKAKEVKKIRKSHKKRNITLGCIGAAAAVCGITFALNVVPGKWIRDRFFPQPAQDIEMQPMTANVTVTDVQQILSTTGTVTSSNRQIQNARSTDGGDATGYVVDTVNVKVGDEVKAGDVLFTIDMTKTESELELNQQKLALQEQQNSIDSNAAQRQYNEAAITTGNSYRKQTRLNEDAQEDYNNAVQEPDLDAQSVADLKSAMEDAQQKMKTAQDARDKALAQYQSQQAAAQTATNDSSIAAANAEKVKSEESRTDETGSTYYENPDNVKSAEQDAVNKAYTAQVASAAANDAQLAYNNANDALTKATDDYSKAESAYEGSLTARRAQDTQLESAADEAVSQYETGQAAADKVASQNITNQTGTLDTRQTISNDQKALENREVVASIDGTVTEVNVIAGQTYTGNAAVTIDDLSGMRAVAQIDESSIADIGVGTRVEATTDATGSDPVDGTVSYTSPVPTKDATAVKSTTTAQTGTGTTTASASAQTGTSTDSSSATGITGKTKKVYYEVDVDLGANSRLRIGMNTKLNFILKENKNCLAVPKTCVQGDGMGGYFVTRVTGDGSDLSQTEQVMVEIGAQGDYYTAITGGDLKEGDLLIDNSSSDGSDDASAGGLMEGVG